MYESSSYAFDMMATDHPKYTREKEQNNISKGNSDMQESKVSHADYFQCQNRIFKHIRVFKKEARNHQGLSYSFLPQ